MGGGVRELTNEHFTILLNDDNNKSKYELGDIIPVFIDHDYDDDSYDDAEGHIELKVGSEYIYSYDGWIYSYRAASGDALNINISGLTLGNKTLEYIFTSNNGSYEDIHISKNFVVVPNTSGFSVNFSERLTYGEPLNITVTTSHIGTCIFDFEGMYQEEIPIIDGKAQFDASGIDVGCYTLYVTIGNITKEFEFCINKPAGDIVITE